MKITIVRTTNGKTVQIDEPFADKVQFIVAGKTYTETQAPFRLGGDDCAFPINEFVLDFFIYTADKESFGSYLVNLDKHTLSYNRPTPVEPQAVIVEPVPQVVEPQAVEPVPQVVEPVPQVVQPKMLVGIVDLEKGNDETLKIVTGKGITRSRVWVNWNVFGYHEYAKKTFSYLKKALALDPEAIICLAAAPVPNPGNVGVVRSLEALFNRFDELDIVVKNLEVGNEPNLTHYWKLSLADWYNKVQLPTTKWLRRNRPNVRIISTGISWNPKAVRELVRYGMLDNCDAVGFHPYGNTGQQSADRCVEVKSYIKDKPLILTEANNNLGKKYAAKSVTLNYCLDELTRFWKGIDGVVDEFYYFVFIDANTPNSPLCLFDKEQRPTLFWKRLCDLRG